MYVCKHFKIYELVPPQVYSDRGEKAWLLLDVKALMTIDALRDKFGSLTINDYQWGGNFTSSGLRMPYSDAYSPYSQHSYGRAFDCKFKNITAEEVRQYIIANPEEFPYITSYEEGTSWFHFDVRNTEQFLTYKLPVQH